MLQCWQVAVNQRNFNLRKALKDSELQVLNQWSEFLFRVCGGREIDGITAGTFVFLFEGTCSLSVGFVP